MKFGTKNIKKLKAETILESISEYDIFRFYIPTFKKPNVSFCSELRKDHNPTCKISKLNSGWRYKDFGTGETFNCWDYVMEKYGLKYIEALKVISIDFGLGLTSGPGIDKVAKIPKEVLLGNDIAAKSVSEIRVVSRKWQQRDLDYWKIYNIDQKLLDFYKVIPITGYYLDNYYFDLKKEMAFCYQFGNFKYKILRPTSDYKWINNAAGVVQGLAQLKPGGLLFITSSLKDIMTLASIGYKSVAPQSENTLISKSLITKFKENFDEVVLYLNNDEPGIAAAIEQAEKYGILYITNPEGEPKDPSDYVKEYNPESLKQLLKHYGF
jgi:hypothetical protein